MLDYHALVETTGSVTDKNISIAANIPANDGQTAAGVPIAPDAVLKGWGWYTTIADTCKQAKLISQDQIDSINGETWIGGTASTLGLLYFDAHLPFRSGGRNIYINQNTGANPCHGFTVDKYSSPNGANLTQLRQIVKISQTFGGALTANVWGSQAVAPSSALPAGTYAILGFYVHGLTNYAGVRFAHADFGGKKPGMPTVDESKATARAVTPMQTAIFNNAGMQFAALGDIPVFRTTAAGTGLTIEAISITADTPIVNLNLAQLASP